MDHEGAVQSTQETLRFGLGDRVGCNVGGTWYVGAVVELNYREEEWRPNRVAPYQVQLDSFQNALVYVPADIPELVRSEEAVPARTLSLPEDGDAAAAVELLTSEVVVAQGLPFVVKVEGPQLMKVAEQDGKLFEPTSQTGPWLLCAVLRVLEGAHVSDYRVHVKCNRAWPRCTPEVRVCSTINHPCVMEDGVVDATMLHGDGDGLCDLLRALHVILRDGSALAGQRMENRNLERLQTISAYLPLRLHHCLFEGVLQTDWFDSAFSAVAQAGTGWRRLMREEAPNVFSFPLFTADFCKMFVEEVEAFNSSNLPSTPPNSMNKYGVIVNEIGMEPMLDRLQREVLQPISSELFPGIGSHFDQHHSFVVQYKMGADTGLDLHTDNCDVTFNVCLGKEFQGAGLQFCGDQCAPDHRRATLLYQHVKGRCVVHLGYRRHGADDILEGERLNLIVWNRNSEYRRTKDHEGHVYQSRYATEVGPPDPVCLSYTHDRDYGVFKNYTKKTAGHYGEGWCPPLHAEYEGFEEE